jgi:hypothetical protein
VWNDLDPAHCTGDRPGALLGRQHRQLDAVWAMLNLSDVVAQNNNLTTLQTARLSALVGASLADAGIAAREAKYTYNTARPITDIQENTDPSIVDSTWQSLWSAPNFPSYMSGHTTVSAAAAALGGFFGTDSMSFCISADPNAASLPKCPQWHWFHRCGGCD